MEKKQKQKREKEKKRKTEKFNPYFFSSLMFFVSSFSSLSIFFLFPPLIFFLSKKVFLIGKTEKKNWKIRSLFFPFVLVFCSFFLCRFSSHVFSVKESLSYWKNKTNNSQYFIAYDIGKSITKVIDRVVPLNVHKWKLPEGKKWRKRKKKPE